MDDVTLEPAANPTLPPLPAPLSLSFAQVASLGAQASIHAPVPGAGGKMSKSSRDNQNPRDSSNFQSEIIPKSHSPYALIADFSGFNLSQGQVTSLVSAQFSDVETLRFLKQGRAAEIGFLSREHVQAAISSGLIFEERQVPLTRCFAIKHNVVAITIRGLPCYSKKETEEEIKYVFVPYGIVHEVQFKYYPSSSIRTDSCIAILELPMGESLSNIPNLSRRLEFFEANCDLYWKGAAAFCKYCKKDGHWITECKSLARKKDNPLPQVSLSRPLALLPPRPSHLPILPQQGFTFSAPRPEQSNSLVETLANTLHSLKRGAYGSEEEGPPSQSTPPLLRRKRKKTKGKMPEIREMLSQSIHSGFTPPISPTLGPSPSTPDAVILAPVLPRTPSLGSLPPTDLTSPSIRGTPGAELLPIIPLTLGVEPEIEEEDDDMDLHQSSI